MCGPFWAPHFTGKGKDKGERRRDGKGKDGEKGFANVPWLRPVQGVQSLELFPLSAKNAMLSYSPKQQDSINSISMCKWTSSNTLRNHCKEKVSGKGRGSRCSTARSPPAFQGIFRRPNEHKWTTVLYSRVCTSISQVLTYIDLVKRC